MSQFIDARRAVLCSLVWLLIATGVTTSTGRELLYPEAKHGKGEIRYVEGVPVAIFSGTATEMGEQHAALLAKPAAPLLKFSSKFFAEVGAENLWPLAVLASKRLLVQAPERHRQEMDAAAAHADLDAEEISIGNTMLELRRMGCSTLIVEPSRSVTGGPLFGRNFDFPSMGLLDKFSLVTVVRPEGELHSFASVGYPGLFGVVSGMNDAGLAVATLDVYGTGNGSPKFEPTGVPLMLVFRQILEECTTIEEAEKLLKRTKATTWANLAVCDRQRGTVFEITPTEVARRDAIDSVLPCTNHFRVDGLAVNKKCWRFDSLIKAAKQEELRVEDIHEHLHQANQGRFTLHTMVFEPRELVLHLSLGTPPSSKHQLRSIDLKPLLAVEEK